MKWYKHKKDLIRGYRMNPPYDNVFIGCNPQDGMTQKTADSFDAFVNVSDSPCAVFEPSYPGQAMHWYPVNEMGRWSLGYLYWLKTVMDYHHSKGHQIYLHCLSEDTEVLTESGFIKIVDLCGDESIANVDPVSGKVSFSKVKGKVVRDLAPGEKMYAFHFKLLNKTLLFSEKHRMAYLPDLGAEAKVIPNSTAVKDYLWNGSGVLHPDRTLSTDTFLFLAWIVGDGYIAKNGKRYTLNFRFKKQRKIDRIIELMNSLGVKYSKSIYDGVTSIYVGSDSAEPYIEICGLDKKFPIKLIPMLSQECATAIINEMIKIDGDWENYLKRNSMRINSKRKDDIDFFQALVSVNFGLSNANLVMKSSQFIENHFMHYCTTMEQSRVNRFSRNGLHSSAVEKSVSDYSGRVACVETDTGFFIARQGGLTFVTGNCHAGAFRSPSAAVLWLEARGHSPRQALKLAKSSEYLHHHWKNQGNMPKLKDALFKSMRKNPKYSLSSVMFDACQYKMNDHEIMSGLNRIGHLKRRYLFFWYRPKEMIRRAWADTRQWLKGYGWTKRNGITTYYKRKYFFSWPAYAKRAQPQAQ